MGAGELKLLCGERLRICVARVILKDVSVLLLDEAKSGLDTCTER